jgi:hypothetical protein
MKARLSRMNNILLHPKTEWLVIRDEKATYPCIVLRYISILSVIPPAAFVAGRYLFDGNVPGSVLFLSPRHLMRSNVLWYCMYIMDVMIAVVTSIMASAESRWRGVRGLQIAEYSFTPLFIAGFIAVIPHMTRCIHIAFAAASITAAAVIVGVMNLFEYLLESFIMEKILV